MYVFLQEHDSLCYESVASENSTSKSKNLLFREHTPFFTTHPHPLVPRFSSAFGRSKYFGQFLVLPAVVAIIILPCFGQMVCPVDLSILLQ